MADDKTTKGYFQNLTDWVSIKLGSTKKTETTDDTQIIKHPSYLHYLSMGWAGGINPFVNMEADPKEARNVTSFCWIKDKIYGKTNLTEYQHNRNAGFWNMIKFDEEYLKIVKYKVKEYNPDIIHLRIPVMLLKQLES